MIPVWIKMRWQQIFRTLKSVGLLLLLIFIPLAGIGVLGLLKTLQNWHFGYFVLLIVGVITSIHLSRGDGRFLQLHFAKAEIFKILLLEYSLIAIPFYLIAFAAFAEWQVIPFTQIAIAALTLIPFREMGHHSFQTKIPVDWIPIRLFEWRFAFRKFGAVLLLTWLIGFLGVRFVGAPLVSTLLFTVFLTAVFEYLENKELFLGRYHHRFLRDKIAPHLKFLNLLFLPQYLIFFIFHGEYWYIGLAAAVMANMILTFAILKKYATWRPRTKRSHISTQVALFSLFCIVPFLFPVALIWLVVFYRKATGRVDYFFPKG